ncbi:MAG: hypothetical protein ACK5B9_04465 [Flavobacteriia bacterium]|jgi:hypothetical protein
MEFSPSSFVSVNEILSDVLKVVDDSSFKINSPGWYKSQVEQALEELSFDTFFLTINKDFEIPCDLKLELPLGAFNLRQIYVYNGDKCDFSCAQVVYHKSNFLGSGSGNTYLARDRYTNDRDRFHKHRGTSQIVPNNVFFYGIQQGIINLSPNCKQFQKVMLVYNGIQSDIANSPIVPLYLRQAVKDFVTVKGLETRIAQETVNLQRWNLLLARYDNSLNHPYDGSWVKAERRVKTLDNKHRQDMKEYLSRMNY